MLILIWSLSIEQIKVQGMFQHFISLMQCHGVLVPLNLFFLGVAVWYILIYNIYNVYIIREKLVLPLVGRCFRGLTSWHGGKWQVQVKSVEDTLLGVSISGCCHHFMALTLKALSTLVLRFICLSSTSINQLAVVPASLSSRFLPSTFRSPISITLLPTVWCS